ncbi:MAG: hypothetical protein K9M36_01345 [Candidatus Pacebacteria bacterium]|nr:hypothetical protein [Candidatus Paceibacterota bacterium]
MNMQEAVSENKKISFSISTRSIWSMLGFITICGFGYLQAVYFIIPGITEFLSYFDNEPVSIETSVRLIWVPIIGYLIIGTGICLLVNAFKKLNGYTEKGLISILVVGLMISFMGALSGIMTSFMMDNGIPFGLVGGLILGVMIGLLWGLVVGFIEEFK